MSTSEKLLHIEIPVKLTEVKAVFSIASLSFEGDLPASLFHLQLIADDIADWNARSQVVAVFHTNAGHVTLHDTAYNAERNIATGNPYKGLVADLIRRGVRSNCVARQPRFTTGEIRTCSLISKSIQMPWQERRNLFKKGL